MAFKNRKWSLKSLATRLLLAPLAIGGLAMTTIAQTPGTQTQYGKSAPTAEMGRSVSDPKELLKLGRRALAAGQFDAARDYARQADANNPSGRWGLTSDTPESLVRDVLAARGKAQKAEADKLVRHARDLAARPTVNDTERLANLEQASVMIDRACTIAGNGGWMKDLNPFVDKPETIKHEIDLARIRLRKQMAATEITPVQAQDAAPVGSMAPSGVVHASGAVPYTGVPQQVPPPAMAVAPGGKAPGQLTPPALAPKPLMQEHAQPPAALNMVPPQVNHNVDAARKLMAEGRALMAANKFAEARAKFIEADKLGVNFPITEDNPGRGITDATVKGKEQLNNIVNNAQKHVDRQEWSAALACMSEGRNLAAALDLRTAPLEQDLEGIRALARAAGVSEDRIVAVANTNAATPPSISPPKEVEKPGTPTDVVMPNTLPTVVSKPAASTEVAKAADNAKPTDAGKPSKPTDVVKPTTSPLVVAKADPVKPPAEPEQSIPELGIGPIEKSNTPAAAGTTTTPGVTTAPGTNKTPAAKPEDDIFTRPDTKTDKTDKTVRPKAKSDELPIPSPKPKPDPGMLLVREAQRAQDLGELEHAREIATKAYNGGYGDNVKQEALKLIRGVDAQEILVKKRVAAEVLSAAQKEFEGKQYESASRLLARINTDLLSEKDQLVHEKLALDAADRIAKQKPLPPTIVPPAPKFDVNKPVETDLALGSLVGPEKPTEKTAEKPTEKKPDQFASAASSDVPARLNLPSHTTLPQIAPPSAAPATGNPPTLTAPPSTPPAITLPTVPPTTTTVTPPPAPTITTPTDSVLAQNDRPGRAPITALNDPSQAQTQGPLPGDPPLVPSTTKSTKPPVKLSEQVGAMAEVEFQQLRDEGLRTEAQAKKSYDQGDTDIAIQMLADFAAKVKASKLSAGKQDLLLTPVVRRMDNFRIMKRQVEFYTKEARTKREQLDNKLAKSSAEQQKHEEVALRVRQVNELLKSHKYKEAEKLAMQARMLDPEDPTLKLVCELAKRNRAQDEAAKRKEQHSQMFKEGLDDAENQGKFVNTSDPIAVEIHRTKLAQLRGSGDDQYIRSRSPIEREIELKLEKPMTLEFQNAPLREVIQQFRKAGDINIIVDDAALNAESVEIDKLTITEKLTSPIALRSIMNLMFQKHGLQCVVENDVVNVTTLKKAKGRLHTKVFSVMDLVTPIPDFALPEHSVLSKAFERNANPPAPWMNAQQQTNPQGGLAGGQLVGGVPLGGNPGSLTGRLDNTTVGGSQNHPLASSAHLAPVKSNASAQLMKLITGMVRPYSWQEMGGPGKIDYYDIGGAMVVNQTADVIKEITDLLESLRRLQDLSIAVEIRVVSLTEDFYERVGVDFAMNIKTNNNLNFERSLTTGSFRPEPFISSIEAKNAVVGWIPPAGGFTSDLKLPIRPNTYGFSVPPFGNYPGNLNGGLNLGLAFLNDIQVYMFMEAAAGNRRINVMQAPKITLFNGQTSTVSVQDFQYFTTGLQVTNVGGQFVYVPQNTPLPVGGGGGGGGGGQPGVTIAVQGVVSSDRRFVRMTLTPSFTVLSSATVPLFPVTAFITPVFEGGSQGVPIPFTQFFQQPAFQTISVQTTVAVPDGGTVLMGGLKTMSEGRNEFGPPVVSNIPYLNRLFKNTAIGRETRHIMLMVTPRIIINLEEEFNQTGGQ